MNHGSYSGAAKKRKKRDERLARERGMREGRGLGQMNAWGTLARGRRGGMARGPRRFGEECTGLLDGAVGAAAAGPFRWAFNWHRFLDLDRLGGRATRWFSAKTEGIMNRVGSGATWEISAAAAGLLGEEGGADREARTRRGSLRTAAADGLEGDLGETFHERVHGAAWGRGSRVRGSRTAEGGGGVDSAVTSR